MSEKERIYDEQIAPLMKQIIDICKREGFGLSGFVELEEEVTVLTHLEPEERHTAQMRLSYYLLRSHGNLDTFFMYVLKDAEENGHNSVYLKLVEMALEKK